MPASPELEAFREAFRLDELTICEQGEWIVSVRPGQITLGSMVISSRSGHLDFQALDRDAQADLTLAFGLVERLATSCFGAVRVNIVCLMMKDPVVHFHVLPRYAEPVDALGQTWYDQHWPGPPIFGPAETTPAVLDRIRSLLEEAA